MEQTNKQQTNKQQTNKQQTNKQQTNETQTNKQQTNETQTAFGGPILPTFPYGGLPLEFKNFSLTILPLTKQLNFYDKTHKCSLAVELTTSELALFEWFANTLVEVAQANTQTTGPQDTPNVAAD